MSVPRHYHIRWLPSGALDWQRFETLTEAATRAEELVLPGERYKLEEFAEACATCAPLYPQSALHKNVKKRAAG